MCSSFRHPFDKFNFDAAQHLERLAIRPRQFLSIGVKAAGLPIEFEGSQAIGQLEFLSIADRLPQIAFALKVLVKLEPADGCGFSIVQFGNFFRAAMLIEHAAHIEDAYGVAERSGRSCILQRLKKLADSRFDYGEMTKRSLGAHWNKMSEGEQTEFVDLFTKLLTATYADKIGSYSGEQVKYLEERLEGDDYAEVRTKMVGKTTIPLDYRLLKKQGEWRAYDVIIDGVSLVQNYRRQFTSIMQSSSYDHLVQTLREKVEKYEEREAGQVSKRSIGGTF